MEASSGWRPDPHWERELVHLSFPAFALAEPQWPSECHQVWTRGTVADSAGTGPPQNQVPFVFRGDGRLCHHSSRRLEGAEWKTARQEIKNVSWWMFLLKFGTGDKWCLFSKCNYKQHQRSTSSFWKRPMKRKSLQNLKNSLPAPQDQGMGNGSNHRRQRLPALLSDIYSSVLPTIPLLDYQGGLSL